MLSGHDIEATFAMDTYEDRCRRMVNDTLRHPSRQDHRFNLILTIARLY